MALPGLIGFAGSTAAQSAIFALLDALLRKGSRGALKVGAREALRKVPGFAGKTIPGMEGRLGQASVSGVGREALLDSARTGATFGIGDAALQALLSKVGGYDSAPQADGAMTEIARARAFLHSPVIADPSEPRIEDLLAMLGSGRFGGAPTRRMPFS